MIISNKDMMDKMDAADRERYFPNLVDMTLAGDDYKVTEVVFFAKDVDSALNDYIQVKKYDDSFLLIRINTTCTELLTECMEMVDQLAPHYNEIEVRTPFEDILRSEMICGRYDLAEPAGPANPVYYVNSSDELTHFSHGDNIVVRLLSEEDKEHIAKAEEDGRLETGFLEGVLMKWSCFTDVKPYVILVDGEVVGYLRGECGYKNIYDIGWIHVEPKYRGKGYAPILVEEFSRDMFRQGLVPHYGYAVSAESVSVAKKCGYKCDPTPLFCKSLRPKQC